MANQDSDSLAYFDRTNDYQSMQLAVRSMDPLTSEHAYYLIKSYNLLPTQVAIDKTDSLLSLTLFSAESVWKQRALAARISFLRKNGAYEEVIRQGNQSITTFTDTLSRFDVAHNMSISFRRMNAYDSAMSLAIQILKLANTLNDPLRIHRATQNLANLHSVLDEPEQAKKLEIQLIDLADNMENSDLMILDRTNLASTYIDLGRYDSARFFFEKALALSELTNQFKRIPLILYNMGSLEYREDHYTFAITLLKRCIEQAEQNGEPTILVRARYLLTLCYLELNQLDEVAKQIDGGIRSAAHYGLRQDKLYFMELSAYINQRQGNYEEVIETLQAIRLLEDSILNEEKIKSIQELQTKYDTEQKEQQIISLKQENQINELRYSRQLILIVSLAAIILLVVGLLYFVSRLRRIATEKQKLLTEQRLLRSQMNPHFLYNALASINAFIFTGNKYEASEYLTTFSELTRKLLTYSSKEWVTVQEELSIVEQYLEIQKLRFPEIEFRIDCEEPLVETLIPPLLLQPFVENSIVHGFKETTGGHIAIELVANGHDMVITISDDGVGLKETKKDSSKAIQIANDRINLLYQDAKKYNIVLENNSRHPGAVVRITLPIKEFI
ncbi:histidine kinase [Marinoscillum sp.]|uniref:histidine kinase n=1 Tax=Marinoscillum sp. TaxID=2024838 RepID=UPI003BA8A2A3